SRSRLLASANCAVSVSAKPRPNAFVASSWLRERNGKTARIRGAVGLERCWLLHPNPTSAAKITQTRLAATTIPVRFDWNVVLVAVIGCAALPEVGDCSRLRSTRSSRADWYLS